MRDNQQDAEDDAAIVGGSAHAVALYDERALDAAVAAERERVRGGNDLAAMCEAFHRLIEAHAQRSPFHQPVVADAQIALRVLRGVVAGLGA